MGVAGALFAHKVGFLAPDIFSVLLSIQFLLMVVVGGLGSLHGALFGAVFVALLPVAISQARDVAAGVDRAARRASSARASGTRRLVAVDRFVKQPGLEPGIFGLILVLFILFEPLGIYGRWLKLRLFFSTLPAVQARRPSSARRRTCARSACGDASSRPRTSPSTSAASGPSTASASRSSRARSSRSSAPTARARRRSSTWSAASTTPAPAGSSSATRTSRGCRRTRSPGGASRAPFRTSSCSSTPPCCRTCCSAGTPTGARASSEELLFLPRVRGARARAPRGGREGHRLPRPAALPRQPDRQPPLRRAQGGGDGARAVHASPTLLLLDEPSSGLNVEETEDMAFWIQDITHPARHHRADGRARHEPGERGVRPRAGAELRPAHRAGHARARCRSTPRSSRPTSGAEGMAEHAPRGQQHRDLLRADHGHPRRQLRGAAGAAS